MLLNDCNSANCVDAPSRPALRTVLYASTCPPLLRHCLQNLVQYFKLAYVFSVLLQSFSSFVIVLNKLIYMQVQPLKF